MSVDLFREAVKAVHNGRSREAHELLQELLMGQPRHEMGWLWLSKISPDIGEQIHALETVLSLNPGHDEALYRLPELKAARKQQQQTDQAELMQEAVWAYRNGRHHQARQYLLQITRNNPTHLKAWIGLAQVAPSPAEKIVALEMVVDLNPQHTKAAAALQKLKADFDDPLALGLAYKAVNLNAKALTAFQYATKKAPNATDRHIAGKHARELQASQPPAASEKQQNPPRPLTMTSDNATLIRLGLGPLIVYLLLIFIHGGLNPLHVPWLAYLGIPVVALGGLLIAGAANTPHHPYWHKIFGQQGIPNRNTAYALAFIGSVIVLFPILLVLTISYNELIIYYESLASRIN
ncbi:MAG TPA: hypothetical protein PLD25_00755 [Chloroflexota bacterium]|nr:hypothetical protein [Chloroflexota bacterium]